MELGTSSPGSLRLVLSFFRCWMVRMLPLQVVHPASRPAPTPQPSQQSCSLHVPDREILGGTMPHCAETMRSFKNRLAPSLQPPRDQEGAGEPDCILSGVFSASGGVVLESGQTKHWPTPRHATASSLFCRDVCICLLSRATYLPVSSAPSMNWMVDTFLT